MPPFCPIACSPACRVETHAARLERAIRKGAVLAAETPRHGVLGLARFGAARDHGLGFDGEVYTLYVDPDFWAAAWAARLLHGAFAQLKDPRLPFLPDLEPRPKQCLLLL